MDDRLAHMGGWWWINLDTGETVTTHPDHPRMQLLTEYPHLPQISNEYE